MNSQKNVALKHQFIGVLSDRDIKAAISQKMLSIKSPYDLKFQPSSIDVHIAPVILTFSRRRVKQAVIDLKNRLKNIWSMR